MFDRLIRTDDDLKMFVIRVTLGLVILPHGLQKLLGWFGGGGPEETIRMFGMAWGIPAAVTVLIILGESFGALALVLGFLGRFMAASIAVIMAGAVALVHGRWGFFMNWYGRPQGEGFEYHLLVFGMVAAILIGGSGRWSVDRMLTKRRMGAGAGYAPAERAAGPERVGAR